MFNIILASNSNNGIGYKKKLLWSFKKYVIF